jgi:phosphoribosyl 1,2-cyclic phosphodiesterase
MKIKLHGVRGSLPTPLYPPALESRIVEILESYTKLFKATGLSTSQFLNNLPHHMKGGYGGNTACTEVSLNSTKVLIDTGSGIRNSMNDYLAEGCGSGTGVVNILFTHFHWDHILGLPFFVPMYIKGNQINFYSVQDDTEEVVRTLFKKPFFPIPFEALESKINFIKLKPREINTIGDLEVTPYLLDHPDPCWGFKISGDGKNYAHCVDSESIRNTRESLGQDLPLYQDIDLMLFDAQYSMKEAEEKKNWGHGSAPLGLEIAVRENIKKIVFSHHDPMASDEAIAKISKLAVKYFESHMQDIQGAVPEWSIAREGAEYVLI